MFVVPAEPRFQGDGHACVSDDGVQDAFDQRFVLQQCATGQHVAHFFDGAAHIDVDDLRAVFGVVPRGVRHLFGVTAGNLHHDNAVFALVVAAVAAFLGVLQAGVAGQHFAHCPICAPLPRGAAGGVVGDAGHGGEGERCVRQRKGEQGVCHWRFSVWESSLHLEKRRCRLLFGLSESQNIRNRQNVPPALPAMPRRFCCCPGRLAGRCRGRV